jgi:acyl carrier protein
MRVHEKLEKIFQQVFDDEGLLIYRDTTADDIDGWDSLSHMNLIVYVQSIYNIRFTQKEILSFKNVGDLEDGIYSKINK